MFPVKHNRKVTAAILLIIFLASVVIFLNYAFSFNHLNKGLTTEKSKKLNEVTEWIQKGMNKGDIPGMSVIVVKNNETLYQRGFGYENYEKKVPVTIETAFELGSTSKGFTALSILQLEEQGLLQLKDPVSKYLPWFNVRYKGIHKGEEIDRNVEITIGQLLHHTSGIPFQTIENIPKSVDDDALEKTVKTLSGIKLDSYPGEKFSYATINYDVLGLVVEKVTGISFEEYIKTHVLMPLGMNKTYLDRSNVKHMATGYKLGFMRPIPYDAPRYRGNTPAGYVITNSTDLEKWLKLQLGGTDNTAQFANLIEKSHIPDRTVPAIDGASYASGWYSYQYGKGELAHEGQNPNFSSYLIVSLEDDLAIGVLANINSSYVTQIGKGILSIMRDEVPKSFKSDTYQDLDYASLALFVISNVIIIWIFVSFIYIIIDFYRKQRTRKLFRKQMHMYLAASLLIMAYIGYCTFKLPNVLFWGLTWEYVRVWAPYSFVPAVYLTLTAIALFIVYFLTITIFPKRKEKPLFTLILLSFVSGFGNSLIIFSVLQGISRAKDLQTGIVFYFILGILLYVAGQKIIRNKMIQITQELVYEKRTVLINNILNTPFFKFEKIEKSEIYSGLRDDTSVISDTPNIIIGCITNIVTLLCCFIYLGVMNPYGLIVSIVIIILAAGLYFLIGNSANRLWEQTRDIQNQFFGFINDMVEGFKELYTNSRKKLEFKNDIDVSNVQFRDMNSLASKKYVNAFVIGELLFVIVIGVVAYIFPLIFKSIDSDTLRNYVFVFLYMTGPVNGVLGSIPNIVRTRISWNRLHRLMEKTNANKEDLAIASNHSSEAKSEHQKLALEKVEFQYDSYDQSFSIGPVTHTFNTGEITFITGGNGSGKTTLAKVITGLYKPDQGKIMLNGKELNYWEIGENFSCVFSDFYLFKRLYGIDFEQKNEEIDHYLNLLQIQDKLRIHDGIFSSLDLSTGQRKRMALLLSYLEDKRFVMFDEWAADQDPQFRKYFYEELLLELKEKGKSVIVITHDDRYFPLADKIIKMNLGQVEHVSDGDKIPLLVK